MATEAGAPDRERRWRLVASRIRYCHGTSSALLPPILERGLLPRIEGGRVRPSVYEGRWESKRLDAVYLSVLEDDPTLSFCWIAARRAVERFGGGPAVLEVELEPSDFERYVRDEDFETWETEAVQNMFRSICRKAWPDRHPAKCLEPPVLRALEQAVKEGVLREEEVCDPPSWFAELACFGRFAVRGSIPPERIRVVHPPVKGGGALDAAGGRRNAF